MKNLFTAIVLILTYSLQAQTSYFQQKVDCIIKVSLDDESNFLNGTISIIYQNNSPQSLDTMWFHLWPNAYENNQSAFALQQLENGSTDFYTSTDEEKGFIDSLDFVSEGKKLKWNYHEKYKDACYVVLAQKLLPTKSVSLQTTFRVKIPDDRFSRLGQSSGNFAITQWYPKPAVYDQNGWNVMPYLTQGEFYSEFGSFDVSIRLPENFQLAATGILQNPESENLFRQTHSTELLNNAFNDTVPLSSKTMKELRFLADSVHDFAWFASKTFVVKSKKVILPSGREIECTVFYHPEHSNSWENSLNWVSRSVIYYSQKVGEYPYNQLSVVDGSLAAGGGMEYPMITIINNDDNLRSLEETIIHEIGHNWFYGILASDERQNAWMDEGMTTFYQYKYSNYFYPNSTLFSNYLPEDFAKKIFKLGSNYEPYFIYLFSASRNLDSKPCLPAVKHSSSNYGTNVYYKTAMSFAYLNDYLGDEKFDSIIQAFYGEWKFKHPKPNDLVDFFALHTNNSSDVFFQELICSTGKNDYAIRRVKQLVSDSILLVVKNKGGLKLPVNIYQKDAKGNTIFSEWFEGFEGSKSFSLPIKGVSELGLDLNNSMMDVNFYNQTANTAFKIKTFRKPRLKFVLAEPDKTRADLYFTPVAGYNMYNGFMLGALFYNSLIFEKKWEYRVMPMFSFETSQIASEIGLYRNFYPINSKIRKIGLGATTKFYSYDEEENWTLLYLKLQPEAVVYFRYPENRSFISSILSVKLPIIFKNTTEYIQQDSNYVSTIKDVSYQVLRIHYDYKNNRKLYPFSLSVDAQTNQNFVKIGFEYKHKINYSNVKSGFYFRFFAGKVFSFASDDFDYSLKMSNQTGTDDYLMDETFVGRSEYEGTFSNQMNVAEGGFDVKTAIGKSNDWIVSVNLKSSLYKINFIKLYFNAGTYANAKDVFPGSQLLLYEGGINLSIIQDAVEFYFPLFYSSDIKNELYLNNRDAFGDRIRFVLKFDMANPFKWLKELNL